MHDHCIRKIKMLPQEWQRLHQLAEETHSYTSDGPNVRQVSWLALIRRIARGELIVTERQTGERRRQLEAIDRSIAENEKRAKKLAQPPLFEAEPAG